VNWAKTAGFIILGYVVFTTMKGNLRKWLQIIGLKPDDTSTQSSANFWGNLKSSMGSSNFGGKK